LPQSLSKKKCFVTRRAREGMSWPKSTESRWRQWQKFRFWNIYIDFTSWASKNLKSERLQNPQGSKHLGFWRWNFQILDFCIRDAQPIY
jgi:hypothetical protein